MDETTQQPTAANGGACQFLDGRVVMLPGDCQAVLPTLEADSLDSCVTDPPYHLHSIVKRFAKTGRTDKTWSKSGPHQRTAAGFMNQKWDGGDIAFQPALWAEVLRVLKPGAYLVAFSSTRTFGRMACAIEDAGFIVHPFIAEMFAASERAMAFLRSLSPDQADAFLQLLDSSDLGGMLGWVFGQGFPKAHKITASGLSDLDRLTQGWAGWHYGGQALKPAIEPIFVGQKPFAKGLTGSQNVQRYGVGALNIEGCRISAVEGRWPANVVHDGSHEVVGAFPEADGVVGAVHDPNGSLGYHGGARGHYQAGRPDSGSVSRFYYTAKADADDRLGSGHPTVKPLDLMQWLVRLVTPPGGQVLDLFAGTGTLGEAAWREGCRAVLIERETAYQDDIRRRMALCRSGPGERGRESGKAKAARQPTDNGPLFGPLARDAGDT